MTMDNRTSNNAGQFYWWFGVVEDRDDPLRMGRCRVRIMGYHIDEDKFKFMVGAASNIDNNITSTALGNLALIHIFYNQKQRNMSNKNRIK